MQNQFTLPQIFLQRNQWQTKGYPEFYVDHDGTRYQCFVVPHDEHEYGKHFPFWVTSYFPSPQKIALARECGELGQISLFGVSHHVLPECRDFAVRHEITLHVDDDVDHVMNYAHATEVELELLKQSALGRDALRTYLDQRIAFFSALLQSAMQTSAVLHQASDVRIATALYKRVRAELSP